MGSGRVGIINENKDKSNGLTNQKKGLQYWRH